MAVLAVGDSAPDFSLPDLEGNLIKLSEIYRSKNVVLVFNLGFA
jgi:peroxiredoxin